MKRTNFSSQFLIVLSAFFVMGSWCYASVLPTEPNEDYLVSEDVNSIAGLYYREYSLAGNGVSDYRTARQIILSEYNEFWNSVVHTIEHPLFYWYDSNGDGQLEMWVDQKVEGCSCDIVPYEATYQE